MNSGLKYVYTFAVVGMACEECMAGCFAELRDEFFEGGLECRLAGAQLALTRPLAHENRV